MDALIYRIITEGGAVAVICFLVIYDRVYFRRSIDANTAATNEMLKFWKEKNGSL